MRKKKHNLVDARCQTIERRPVGVLPVGRNGAAAAALLAVALAAATTAHAQDPCVVPDNGTGTVTLPPIGCEYLSPDEVHMIIDGLPPGTTIELDPIHWEFFCPGGLSGCSGSLPPGECEAPGGTLGGHFDCFESYLDLTVTGTGDLTGFNRHLSVPIFCEVHTGPRTPGDPVQTFPTEMFRLQGDLFGDPDFCTFRVTGGADFGLPGPGQTTLTQQGTSFAVDSFFDITYQIEFEGCPGSVLDGFMGTTTATIRMQTPPQETEACCYANGSCEDLPPSQCMGTSQGPGSICLGDYNGDGINDACDPDICIEPDNGTGTADLPPDCDYLSPDEVHLIIEGLPPGTTIELDPIHQTFVNVTRSPGGTLGGEIEVFDSTLDLTVSGTGELTGFNRHLAVPVACEVHTGPRNPGDPVQTFQCDMYRLEGELFGDPDFCEFIVTAGTDLGMPGPGEITLTELPTGDYAVDSFFDITYQIEFAGCPGSVLDGYAGTTTATIRMQTGYPTGDPAEACCMPDGSCVYTTPELCQGTPMGAGTDCSSVICPQPPSEDPCVVPDNGTGTVTLPPIGCDYLSPDEVHMIIDGLPPGTTMELDPIHMDFICFEQPSALCSMPLLPGECETEGGSLGGHGDCFESTLDLTVTGTGELEGFNRHLAVPVNCEVHTGPRNPGDPVQTFPSDMFRLQGELFGDPDFCTFRVIGGTDYGLPGPGQTSLVQLPSGDFAVDSFFDITYQIEFEGCPSSQLADYAGTTTATLRMQTRRASDLLLITEIVDGDLEGGKPKFVEITNCGDEPINLAAYRIAIFSNGSTTEHLYSMSYGDMVGILVAGDSFVVANPNCGPAPGGGGEFLNVYGFEADLYDAVANGNGNDVYMLYRTNGSGGDFAIDVYGRIGECTGTTDYSMDWAYLDSYAYSLPDRLPNGGVFDATWWFFGGNGALDRPTEPEQIQALQDYTTPADYLCYECAPTADGSACKDVACPDITEQCLPRCVNFNTSTGETTVIDCECLGPDDCQVGLVGGDQGGPRGDPCLVADNGTGTVTLPPIGCDYLSPDEVHMIIDGLPPGTTMELDPIHMDFICYEQQFCTLPIPPGECEMPGGSLGGHGDCFDSTLDLTVTGTGDLAGFSRHLAVPVECEVHTGPRNPGDPVQAFPSDMFRLQGELFGDPDFCTFRVLGGTDFGLPGPGQTTLTRQPTGDFAVDSFFDITYQIEFEGCPDSQLADMSGITTATIYMETGFPEPPSCIGDCPEGMVCAESVVDIGDGTQDICCDCICSCLGDLNGDLKINGEDIQGFIDCVLIGSSPNPDVRCECGDFDVPPNGTDTDDIPAFVDALLYNQGCL